MDIVAELGGKEALVHFGIVTAAAIGGQLVHYFKQWTRGEVASINLWQYITKDHPRRSLATFGAILSTSGTALLTGQLDPSHINGLIPLIALGGSMGYVANSTINKGADPDKLEP